MISQLVSFVFRVTIRRVELIRNGQLFFLALLIRQTSDHQAFRPINCFCCRNCSSLLAPAMYLHWLVKVAAPDPSSCLLATKTCLSQPGDFSSSILFAGGAPNFVLLIRTHSCLFVCLFGLALPPYVHLTVRPLRATFVHVYQLCPRLPRQVLLLFLRPQSGSFCATDGNNHFCCAIDGDLTYQPVQAAPPATFLIVPDKCLPMLSLLDPHDLLSYRKFLVQMFPSCHTSCSAKGPNTCLCCGITSHWIWKCNWLVQHFILLLDWR